ncbi:MAG: Rieske (2Fe-2S) protein [Myxococcota bacterium]
MTALVSVARYRRRVGASLERVWENVRDWEHLPWLHRDSFKSIALREAGDFGWRARAEMRAVPGTFDLELVIGNDDRYVSRTLSGPGAGTEIWTSLDPVDAAHTDIEVEFCLPDVPAERVDAFGERYVALYTQLWDEDEAMMQRRSWLLDGPGRGALAPDAVDLGPVDALASRVPLRVEVGGRPVVVWRDEDNWLAFDALCPHALGPLDAAPIESGRVICPWHGYAFDVRSGRGCDGHERLRLASAPRLEQRDGHLWALPAAKR